MDDGKAEERNLLSFLKASNDDASIEAARDAADPIVRKANIVALIPIIAEELSKLKKGKPGVIEELKKMENFHRYSKIMTIFFLIHWTLRSTPNQTLQREKM